MEEISVLIERAQTGDKKAREVLVENNLGLVRVIVRRFLGRGLEAEDLFQIGSIGLIKAIDKFDLKQGVKFSTYAVPMITGEIKRFLRDDGPVKISRTIKENTVKIARARQRLAAKLNRDPTLFELSEEAGLSKEDTVLALEAGAEVESLYSAVKKEDGSTMFLVDRVVLGGNGHLGEKMNANGMFYEDAEKEKVLNHMLLEQLLDSLDAQDRSILRMRYFQNKTQTQVAFELGISQVQVSRLEKKILRSLREQIS